jgi:3-deoxy-D-manno-octulosonic-acid transferase
MLTPLPESVLRFRDLVRPEVLYFAYTLLLAAGLTLSVPFYLWKERGTGKYRRTFRERMGRLPPEIASNGRPSVWIHAVSVGEVLAARPLVAALKERLPGHGVFVSTTTPTGNAVARRSLPGVDGLFFAPLDFPGAVRRVLERIAPRLVVLVETELWPNLIHEARRRGARVALVNGRISPRSYPRYRLLRPLLAPVLAEVDAFLMQGDAHAERVRTIGAPADRVRVTGNLKFEALQAPRVSDALARVFEGAGARSLWVAGSTAAGEEAEVLAAFRTLRARLPELRLVLAPRHPERFDDAFKEAIAAGFGCVRRSALEGAWTEGDVLLLDTMGELAQAYAYATLVFVGGSLVPAGGHNVLEAALAGKAIIVGSHMENFQEIADLFRAEAAFVQVASGAELSRAALQLLTDETRRNAIGGRGKALIDRNRGALATTVQALAALIA